jgi:F-type H+-transporting ATPase subunit b
MISLDFSVVYQILLFLVFWAILSKILFRPYLAVLEERERNTSGARHETGDLEHEGERLRAQYEEKIAQAEAAGNALKEAILQEARQQRDKILSQAREEAMSALQNVRREVQTQLEIERQRAVAQIIGLARDMVSKILGRSIA